VSPVRRPLTDNVILLVYLITCCGEYQQAQYRIVAGLPTSKRFARTAISLVHVFVRGGISNISMDVLPASELLAKQAITMVQVCTHQGINSFGVGYQSSHRRESF
jgi:hypothetical protein